MLFAIVDIETTGSYASGNGITEIAIVIHDGSRVIDCFESMVNPNVPIPYFIQRLTGITDAMVSSAPQFSQIAERVYNLLQDKIFVAHNVNFDYSFVKYQLNTVGYQLNTKKLCTVRLARKVLPGLNGYSLVKLSHQLGLCHQNAHRAAGDALATAELFTIIFKKDNNGEIQSMLNANSKDSYLPPNLPVSDIDRLPSTSGVYYFYNAKNKVIYVGKAKNLHRRVKSHFTNNKPTRQKQDFIRETTKISYKQCATELMAEILESSEIRRLWPKYNYSQKGYLPQFALLTYTDIQGYTRFALEKNKTGYDTIYTFNTIIEGRNTLLKLINEFGLCPKLCNINFNLAEQTGCECIEHLPPKAYNKNAESAILKLKKQLPTFAIVDKGLNDNEHSCVLVLDGNLYGMGYLEYEKAELKDLNTLIKNLEPLKDNDFIRNLVFYHASEYPEKCVVLS